MHRGLIILLFLSSNVFGNELEETELQYCRTIGYKVYAICILNPTPSSEICVPLYGLYGKCSSTLNSPRIMTISSDASPFSASAYDICKFEVDHLIMWELCNIKR